MAYVGIACEVWHEEEVAIAVIQFHLWTCDVIGIKSKQGIHKALEIALALDEAANGCGVVILATDMFHHLAPLTTIGRKAESIFELANLQRLNLVVFHQHIIIILLADVIIWNSKDWYTFLYTFDCHHTIIEQEALEHVGISQLVGRKGALHSSVCKSILGNLQ